MNTYGKWLGAIGTLLASIVIVYGYHQPPTKANTPPGTVYFKDNLCMDRSYVKNLGYLEFLSWDLRHGRDCVMEYVFSINRHQSLQTTNDYLNNNCFSKGEDLSLLPKYMYLTQCQIEDTVTIDSYVIPGFNEYYYLRHPVFLHYPTINVTRDNAALFCRWRTAMWRISRYAAYSDKKKARKEIMNFEFRLPYYHELKEFANNSIAAGQFYKSAETAPSVYNCIPEKTPAVKKQRDLKNAYFFNIYELTQDEDSLFYVLETDTGLAFFNKVDEVNVGKRHTGFRCVCEIKE